MRTEASVAKMWVWFHFFFSIVLCWLVSITAKAGCRSTNGGGIAVDENKDLQALMDYNGIVEAASLFCVALCFEHSTWCRVLYNAALFLCLLLVFFLPSGRVFLSSPSVENTLMH